MFKNKVLLITGGTGSFGNAAVRRYLETDIGEIRILSRDEKKQDDMRNIYNNPKLKFYIGDVRNAKSVKDAMRGVDFVFHASALKQVPSCEFFPGEAVRTNILGLENIVNAAVDEGVKTVICLSTDKAVYPINAMGMSKALMEKIALAKSRDSNNTKICVTRYGNVMCSRGSVIPLFIKQITENIPLTVTDPNMTRFMMSLDHAIDLVIFAFINGVAGDTFIKKAPAATIGLLAETLCEIFDRPLNVNEIGCRHGEKIYESLLTDEEMLKAVDMGDYYRIPIDTRDLNYEVYTNKPISTAQDIISYNSANTYRLSKPELKKMLLSLDYVQEHLNKL